MKTKFILSIVVLLASALLFNACTQEFTCTDGKQNQGETGIDCGGPCDECVRIPACGNGIQDATELGIDCGGACPPCPAVASCSDGIQNQDETGVDCGGVCPACDSNPSEGTCSDGIQNQDETGVDCGGVCTACDSNPSEGTCSDGIQNQDETGVDCGGVCPACDSNPSQGTCSDGIQNQDETGVDCGGVCPSCGDPGTMSAVIETEEWTAITATANQSDSMLVIIGNDDTWRVSINYSGDFEVGEYDLLSVGTISIVNSLTNVTCSTITGNVNFTDFNTTDQTVSGTFSCDCGIENTSDGSEFRITDGLFENVRY